MKKTIFSSSIDFETAIQTTRNQILGQGFRILTEVPTSQIARNAGFETPDIHQILFFRPDYLKTLIDISVENLEWIPLKAILSVEQGQTIVRLVGPREVPQAMPLIEEINDKLSAIQKALEN